MRREREMREEGNSEDERRRGESERKGILTVLYDGRERSHVLSTSTPYEERKRGGGGSKILAGGDREREREEEGGAGNAPWLKALLLFLFTAQAASRARPRPCPPRPPRPRRRWWAAPRANRRSDGRRHREWRGGRAAGPSASAPLLLPRRSAQARAAGLHLASPRTSLLALPTTAATRAGSSHPDRD
eukprot:scaffold169266_cov29-Tisochrysis_lutea.AAC.5